MKILYVVHAPPWSEFSGTPLIAGQYARQALAEGWEVCLLTASSGDAQQKPVEFHNLKHGEVRGIDNWSLDAFLDQSDTPDRGQYRLPFKPDIVHILDWVGLHPDLLGHLKALQVPIVRHVWNFEDMCYFMEPIRRFDDQRVCQAPLDPETCAACAVNLSSVKLKTKTTLRELKLMVENYSRRMLSETLPKFRQRRANVSSQFDTLYDHLVFPSRSFADYFGSHLKIQKPVSVVTHGISVQGACRVRERKDNEPLRCIFAGGDSDRKGWKIVERVFARMLSEGGFDLKLRIYGCRSKAADSILRQFPQVEFFDSYHPTEMTAIFQWAHVGILPTAFETYCRAVREYLLLGVVPLASRAFGIPDIVDTGRNGILLDEPMDESLYQSLAELMSSPHRLPQLQDGLQNTMIKSEGEEFMELKAIYQSLTG